MKISLNWLNRYLDLDKSPGELADVLPMLGFEIETVLHTGPPPLENVVVGEVREYHRHPDADRLRVCKVDVETDGEPRNIVCGASNFEAGDRVLVALPGAVLPGGFKIKKTKLRGEPSEGMICSAKELELGEDHSGIIVLTDRPAVGTPVNEVYRESDTVFDLEVTPNRPDALCHIGIARELAAFFRGQLHYPEVHASSETPPDEAGAPLLREVEVSAPDICPHYTATCIRGVQVGPSPEWLRSAIEAIGLRPINNVVDVTNFVLHETCQPLHAFDAAKIRGERLVVRRALEGETITTLDEKERSLRPEFGVIADAERPLVLAGIMGSEDAEVDATTTDVVLEAAYFNPDPVRSTSRQLGLSSDSSYRFERGVDPAGVQYAALRAADLILETAGGRVSGPMIEEGREPPIESTIELWPDEVRRFIGFEVDDATMKEVLESLELAVAAHDESDGRRRWEVSIPTFRGDLQRPVDLIEEIVRVYGTNGIPDTAVVARGICETDSGIHVFNEAAGHYLSGRNFDEACLYSLRDGNSTERWFGPEHARALRLANPLQSDQSHLRASLVPGLVDTLRLNNARGAGATRFFERGRVFRVVGGEVLELVSVGFVITAAEIERSWRAREQPDFFTARTICENILKLAGVDLPRAAFRPVDDSNFWQPGHAARAGDLARDGYICETGLLNTHALKDEWDVRDPVLAGSVCCAPELLERDRTRPRHGSISVYPASDKDLALLVGSDVLAGEVESTVAAAAAEACSGFECESVRVFDVYTGEGVPEGEKSLALGMRFRAPDRTLKDKEVNAAFERIQKTITEKTDYTIRK
ncbi:MAG: phenylalanine--tRNA ligase subunit beta [Opitutales bacterium]